MASPFSLRMICFFSCVFFLLDPSNWSPILTLFLLFSVLPSLALGFFLSFCFFHPLSSVFCLVLIGSNLQFSSTNFVPYLPRVIISWMRINIARVWSMFDWFKTPSVLPLLDCWRCLSLRQGRVIRVRDTEPNPMGSVVDNVALDLVWVWQGDLVQRRPSKWPPRVIYPAPEEGDYEQVWERRCFRLERAIFYFP